MEAERRPLEEIFLATSRSPFLLLLIGFGAERPRPFEFVTLRVVRLRSDFYIVGCPLMLRPCIEGRASRNFRQGNPDMIPGSRGRYS
jgi:hypothetical protein